MPAPLWPLKEDKKGGTAARWRGLSSPQVVVRGACDGCWSEGHAPHASSADTSFLIELTEMGTLL